MLTITPQCEKRTSRDCLGEGEGIHVAAVLVGDCLETPLMCVPCAIESKNGCPVHQCVYTTRSDGTIGCPVEGCLNGSLTFDAPYV